MVIYLTGVGRCLVGMAIGCKVLEDVDQLRSEQKQDSFFLVFSRAGVHGGLVGG